MNEFKVLDPNGHSSTTWDPDDAEALERARRTYEALMRRGYKAFRVERGGESGAQNRFDPREKETLFVPPIHAG
jgi:hypothetical protein